MRLALADLWARSLVATGAELWTIALRIGADDVKSGDTDHVLRARIEQTVRWMHDVDGTVQDFDRGETYAVPKRVEVIVAKCSEEKHALAKGVISAIERHGCAHLLRRVANRADYEVCAGELIDGLVDAVSARAKEQERAEMRRLTDANEQRAAHGLAPIVDAAIAGPIVILPDGRRVIPSRTHPQDATAPTKLEPGAFPHLSLPAAHANPTPVGVTPAEWVNLGVQEERVRFARTGIIIPPAHAGPPETYEYKVVARNVAGVSPALAREQGPSIVAQTPGLPPRRREPATVGLDDPTGEDIAADFNPNVMLRGGR